MTSNQIESELDQERNKFYNSVYSGKKDFELIPLFKKCIMLLAPQQHKISMNGIKEIVNAKEDKLTVFYLENIFKVILNVPLGKLYKNFDDAVGQQLKIEKYIIDFNTFVGNFEKEIQARRATMRSIVSTSRFAQA